MSNHYHLCLATPLGNLSEGVRWLQATFAARFNRFRKESGHLFQGRFKSLVVEPGSHLLELVNYIHLNPARAGMTTVSELRRYRWTSLRLLPKVRTRPKWLDASWLDYGEGLKDSRSGWNAYFRLLEMRASDDPKEIDRVERRMNRGWCIGGREFRDGISRELLEREGAIRLEGDELKELNRSHWERALERCLRRLGRDLKEAAADAKSAEWKVAIAARLKAETSATNAWISERLSMGAPNAVSDYCGKYLRNRAKKCPFARKLKTAPMSSFKAF